MFDHVLSGLYADVQLVQVDADNTLAFRAWAMGSAHESGNDGSATAEEAPTPLTQRRSKRRSSSTDRTDAPDAQAAAADGAVGGAAQAPRRSRRSRSRSRERSPNELAQGVGAGETGHGLAAIPEEATDATDVDMLDSAGQALSAIPEEAVEGGWLAPQ